MGDKKIVLQKFIANNSSYSRRGAEELIKKEKILVNNKLAYLGQRVDENDEIKINNKRIKMSKKKIYIKLNKPVGFVCTSRKFKKEKNVFDLINIRKKLLIAGRLDKNSRGLVLLTNDGSLVQKITHPRFEHEKEYLVTIFNFSAQGGPASDWQSSHFGQKINELIVKFKKGVDIGEGDGIVKVKDIKYLGHNKFKIILTQGKKRQIRKMFAEFNYSIKDLVRVGIGDLKLENLAEGKWKYLSANEINSIL